MSEKKQQELGERLADYYNPFAEFKITIDNRYGAVIPNKETMPFDCPTCGYPLKSLQLQVLGLKNKDSLIRMHCASESCCRELAMPYTDFLATVEGASQIVADNPVKPAAEKPAAPEKGDQKGKKPNAGEAPPEAAEEQQVA